MVGKELEDRVEHVSLGKAKSESEVRSLKVESDSCIGNSSPYAPEYQQTPIQAEPQEKEEEKLAILW